MSKYQTKQEGTLALGNMPEITGKEYSLYHCDESLSAASVDRLLGVVRDTIDPELLKENSSFDTRRSVFRDVPALRISSSEQEGFSITYQRWKGVVKEIGEETFVAQISDLQRNVPEEQVEFLLEEIKEDDKELFSIGAEFYWCIGYLISPSGQQIRASLLRFRRLPLFTKDSIKIAAQKSHDIQQNITWL